MWPGDWKQVPNVPREEHIQKESLLEEGCKIFKEQDSPPETVLHWELCPSVNEFKHN